MTYHVPVKVNREATVIVQAKNAAEAREAAFRGDVWDVINEEDFGYQPIGAPVLVEEED